MACDCNASPAKIGAVVNPCPLKDGALWIHVLDDGGGNVKDAVALKNGGDNKPTDASGLATYDPLPAGAYTASLGKLTTELSARYVPPARLEEPAAVSPGQITYVSFELKRKAQLKVRVAHVGDPAIVFPDAAVHVDSGPDKPPSAKMPASGLHDYTEKFGKFSPGSYKLKSVLSADDAKKYETVVDFGAQTHDLELAPGEERTAIIEVESKNLVTPKIELEYKVVLLDRQLSKHRDAKEAPLVPTPTRVELSISEADAAKPDQPYGGTHRYAKGGKFVCEPPNVEVYLDEACTTRLPASGELTAAQLPSGSKLPLYLRGKTAGKFTAKLELKEPADRFIRVDKSSVDAEMGVVELQIKLHHFVAADFDALTADPDRPPPAAKNYNPQSKPNDAKDYHADLLNQYHTTLKDLALPEQKVMTDAQKISGLGRVLCQQTGAATGNQALAKLVVQKLDAGHWPAGTDDYQVYINRTNVSGAVAIFDKEWDGTEKNLPVSEGLKVSELKAADKVYWVEGKNATNAPGGVRLDLTLDRAEGELAKEAKRNADCACFTVVSFKELKVDYTVEADKPLRWDEATSNLYVNLTGTGAGALSKEQARTVTLGAQLGEALAGVKVHFMLAPDQNNQKAANGGEPLPAGGETKRTQPLALDGPDAGCFEIRGGIKLYLVDGMLSIARKPNYEVNVVATYTDGSTSRMKYATGSANNVDSTAGLPVKTYDATIFTTTREQLWKWDTIDKAAKHKDKPARDKYLHVSAVTDDKGYAKADVMLSRGGGDIFQAGCYVDQDPHLAKYVEGHAILEKKKPFFAAKKINVRRRFWVQKVAVESLPSPDFAAAIGQYDRVMADMIQHSDLVVPRSVVSKYSRKGIYPAYMVKVNGGTKEVLLVSALNKKWFFNTFKPLPDKPNMIPILVCDAQWDPHPDGDTSAVTTPATRMNAFPLSVNVGKYAIDPPVQGGSLFVSGEWKAQDWNDAANGGAGDWGPERTGNLLASDVVIDRNRDSLSKVSVLLPVAAAANHASRIWVSNLIVRAAKSYLGESFDKKILAVYDPTEPDDFQNTIAHEIGHAFAQVVRNVPDGNLPVHPAQADAGQGNHCRHLANQCVMYDSGPVRGSLNRYCKICHPYLLWQDMSTIG
jgi:hypothetical protein